MTFFSHLLKNKNCLIHHHSIYPSLNLFDPQCATAVHRVSPPFPVIYLHWLIQFALHELFPMTIWNNLFQTILTLFVRHFCEQSLSRIMWWHSEILRNHVSFVSAVGPELAGPASRDGEDLPMAGLEGLEIFSFFIFLNSVHTMFSLEDLCYFSSRFLRSRGRWWVTLGPPFLLFFLQTHFCFSAFLFRAPTICANCSPELLLWCILVKSHYQGRWNIGFHIHCPKSSPQPSFFILPVIHMCNPVMMFGPAFL